MRITGLATGLDMDQIIKDTMKPYRIKVDKVMQNKEIVEIKQKLYKDIMSDASKFYDKYFDLIKSDNLLNSTNYKSVSFTSSNESVVKITAGSGAKPANYTVTGTSATAAKTVLTDGIENGNKLVINGKEFTLKGTSKKEIAENLDEQLKKEGINVTVRYSDLAGNTDNNKSGLILESTVLGRDSTFTIGGTESFGTQTPGKDGKGSSVIGFLMTDIKNGKISIDGEEIDLGLDFMNDTLADEDRISILNDKLISKNITVSMGEDRNIIFSSTKIGDSSPNFKVSIEGVEKDSTLNPGENAISGSVKFGIDELGTSEKTILINGKGVKIDLSKAATGKEEEYLNNLFKKQGIQVTAKIDADTNPNQVILTSNLSGENSNVTIQKSDINAIIPSEGQDANIKITDEKGGVYTHTGNSNKITLDDVTFTFAGQIPTEGIKITGKTDVKETKDKLVAFINDYNTLIEKLNTLTMTKPDKSYMPLTEEQKKEMSETEVKLWNERVEKGQLYRDTNLTRISDSLKATMRTVMEGSGLNLEKIGIKPSKDYIGIKHGTFTINEDELTKALEENTEDIMNLFIGEPTEGDTTAPEYTSKKGILLQLKDTLYKEFKSSSSLLSKKAGLEGTSTFSNNELTKSISDYGKKIKYMEKDLVRREQALYSKYAVLEKMMNQLNAQQSQLMAQLGTS